MMLWGGTCGLNRHYWGTSCMATWRSWGGQPSSWGQRASPSSLRRRRRRRLSGMTGPGKRSTTQVGIKPRSATPEVDAFTTRPVRLAGLVVKASASRAEDPEFESRLRRIFPGSSHTSDFKIGTPVATLPGAWRYRVSAGTGWPGVSILWLAETERWICKFHLSVAARKIVWAGFATSISVWQRAKLSEQIRPRDTLACCWDVKQASKQPTTRTTRWCGRQRETRRSTRCCEIKMACPGPRPLWVPSHVGFGSLQSPVFGVVARVSV